MSLRRFRALIFDLDDTLYPERAFVMSGFRAAGAWIALNLGYSREKAAQELLMLHDSGARGDTFDRWLKGHGLDVFDHLEQLVDAYRRHAPTIEPYAVVPGLLGRLHTSHKVGLITDGIMEVQERKLNSLGIAGHFDVVVYSDIYGRDAWKPSIKPFEVALSRLNCRAGDAAYIADNPLKDFLGARRLGMGAIRVRHEAGYYSKCEPPTPDHAPDLEIEDICQLEGILSG